MESPRVGEASMETTTSSDAATDLRYALDVMEEYSHLGLDDEFAGKLKQILLKRIEEAEAAVSAKPVQPARFSVPAELGD
jgi:hypothetical protein